MEWIVQGQYRQADSTGAFLTVFVGFGMISGIGAFQTYYRNELLSGYSEYVPPLMPSDQRSSAIRIR